MYKPFKSNFRNYNNCYLLLGSNMGNSIAHLSQAFYAITAQVGNSMGVSAIYQTAPWGNTQQNDFYNQALWIKTPFTANLVLQKCLKIERELGRVRDEKWGPRIIDIDIVFFNNKVISQVNLTIPHPHIQERRFALQCLMDVCPNYRHPLFNKSIRQILKGCTDNSSVKRYYEKP